MKKLRYWIIDNFRTLTIYLEYAKSQRISQWGIKLGRYAWWLKWQHTMKYYGMQDYGANIDQPIDRKPGKRERLLLKILIGKTLQ